jgi:hypothetical protein
MVFHVLLISRIPVIEMIFECETLPCNAARTPCDS